MLEFWEKLGRIFLAPPYPRKIPLSGSPWRRASSSHFAWLCLTLLHPFFVTSNANRSETDAEWDLAHPFVEGAACGGSSQAEQRRDARTRAPRRPYVISRVPVI